MPFCKLCPVIWNSKKLRNNEPQTLRLSEINQLSSPSQQNRDDESEHDVPPVPLRPLATQFKGAHGFIISGSPNFTNIGNVNNYGASSGLHGLEKIERFVSFAARFNSAEQDPDRRCHPRTRKFVLERIQNWINDPDVPERIFWLYGPAGAGKSAIAQTIAHSNPQEKVAGTFFFYRPDPNRNNGNRLFTTLAWQLAFSIPAVKPFIADALDRQPDLPRADVETQFDQLIARPFQLLGNHAPQLLHAPPVVIIDGVDECTDERLQQRFLKVIDNAIKDGRLPLRFLICSRPEALIKTTIDRFQLPPLSVDLAELDDANHDIYNYLKDEFLRVASEKDFDPILWPGEDKILNIVFKSSGNFIFAATVIRYVDDPDNDPDAQLDTILGLKPIKLMSPFAQLDELYIEILKRQVDQDFLKTFLSLLVGRSSVEVSDEDINLAEDDAILMNVSEKELRVKLRRMRSLLSLDPHVVVYHRSFIDFLLDPSRSNQYTVSKEGGIMRYLELIGNWIVHYAARVIEDPDCHEDYHFRPEFAKFLRKYDNRILLLVEEFQSILQPMLSLQDKLLKNSDFDWDIFSCKHCFAFPTMRCLLLCHAVFQGMSYDTSEWVERYTANMPFTSTIIERNGSDMDLDSSLSSLLTWLRYSKSAKPSSSTNTTGLMRTLLRFDNAEVAARVLSVADIQELVDVIDWVMNVDNLSGQFSSYEINQATRLALKLFARASVIPQSLFAEMSDSHTDFSWTEDETIEVLVQTICMSRVMDPRFFVPSFRLCKGSRSFEFKDTDNSEESMKQWRKRSNLSSLTRLRSILAMAKTFQYFHSLNIALNHHNVSLADIFLDTEFCAKVRFRGMMSEDSYMFQMNIFSFGCFFYEVYFNVEIDDDERVDFERSVIVERPLEPKIHDDAWQLIQRCCAEDPESLPTIDEIVEEMESWKL